MGVEIFFFFFLFFWKCCVELMKKNSKIFFFKKNALAHPKAMSGSATDYMYSTESIGLLKNICMCADVTTLSSILMSNADRVVFLTLYDSFLSLVT
jgi:hypothetical protein